ncbi:MAG: hypothetical protein ACI4LP_07440 [Anaerovoracaceae bacterium]
MDGKEQTLPKQRFFDELISVSVDIAVTSYYNYKRELVTEDTGGKLDENE